MPRPYLFRRVLTIAIVLGFAIQPLRGAEGTSSPSPSATSVERVEAETGTLEAVGAAIPQAPAAAAEDTALGPAPAAWPLPLSVESLEGAEATEADRDPLWQGRWPAQVAGTTGTAPGRYGPGRADPAEGLPKHAYSPFDERANREYPCPPGGCDFQPGRVLIKLAPGAIVVQPAGKGAWTADAGLDAALASQGVERLEAIFPGARVPKLGEVVVSPGGERVPKPDLTRWYRATLAPGVSDARGVAKRLAEKPGIAYAEPDFLRKPADQGESTSSVVHPLARGLPADAASSVAHPLIRGRSADAAATLPSPASDPLYGQQWHLGATEVPAAWAYLEGLGLPAGGGRDIVVAVIDTGVAYDHPDLAVNIWTNSREIPANGVDDDADGYVDDLHGADMITNSGNPQDDHGHGTHVAGIIAAQAGNGVGGVGVAYNVQILPIKAAQYSGVLASSDIAEGIYYAVAHGADVINMSFGGYARSQLEEDALTVAFGQAVLVAAAGNDGKVNLPCLGGRDMYPAAYNWVLGVMASTPGGGLARFSNKDCTPHDSHEYELMAPGVDVWSTFPNNQYAAWDGTSMAAPIVSGIAALARTKWADKDVYSSRFIMGQIAANAGPVANAQATLAVAPKPELRYLEHWLFDTAAQGANNDDDGVVDSGETVDLAIVIRNHWGKADPVTVTLQAWAPMAFQPDPYVTILTPTVDYGAIGSFNWDDNGLIYDEAEGVITGVRHPFRFSVSTETPNDHVIPFLLTMTATNGLDPEDTAAYSFQSRFSLIVQRGRELPRIITGTPQFGNAANYPTGSYPYAIASGDFNGDGRADLAVANNSGSSVSVLLSSGNGALSAGVEYAAGANPYAVAAADLNVDGRPDLAVANYSAGTVGIFLNNGDGTFATMVAYAAGANPASLAVADFDGDGDNDLAVANWTGNTASIMKNDGNGIFGDKVEYGTGSNPLAVGSADLNGDGQPDLAIANYNSNTVSVLLNAGDGVFAAKVDYTTGLNPASVAFADFNGDGDLDLAVANYTGGTVSLMENLGTGTFGAGLSYATTSPNSIIAADFNGDNRPDLVSSNAWQNSATLLFNMGEGKLITKGAYATGAWAIRVIAADFDGDSRPDLAVVNSNGNSVSVLLNTGNTKLWDLVVSKDDFWIVPGETAIADGTMVLISEGAQVQWGSPKPMDPYSEPSRAYIGVGGTLLVRGSYTEPVELFPMAIYNQWAPDVYISTGGGPDQFHAKYVKVIAPEWGYAGIYGGPNSIDHSHLFADTNRPGGFSPLGSPKSTTNSILEVWAGANGFGAGREDTVLRYAKDLGASTTKELGLSGWGWDISNSVFLQNNSRNFRWWAVIGQANCYPNESAAMVSRESINNAFLSKYWDPDVNHWMRVSPGSVNPSCYQGLAQNYWGTTSTTLIDAAIRDWNDTLGLARVVYQPILTVPATTTYPFVWDVALSTAGSQRTSIVGAENVTFTVKFNRDMSTTVQPQVSFGPDVPMTDYTIHPVSGGWQDARTWVGIFNVNPITGDGYQLIRVAKAVAADDPWLVTGDDAGRFRFEIITSGTEAMNLQATGGEGYVDLMWTQNDFELLAGFNLYRSLLPDGAYARLNASILPPAQRAFRDTNVQPGQRYNYKFTVVKTDMSESPYSNVAAATPIDTIPPSIVHTPVTQAQPGLSLALVADVTDNVGVRGATLYFRAIGATAYVSRTMVHTTGNRYSATIEGSLVKGPGLEYYLEATDGVSIARAGRAEYPYQVAVVDRPVVTAVSPDRGPSAGGTVATIAGSNFKPGATVTFGGAIADGVTVLSGNQITAVTPAHFPAVVDVTVANPDGQSGTLLRAFTYQSEAASLSIPDASGGQHAFVTIPVNAANIQGLAAAALTITFQSGVLSGRGAGAGTLTPGWSVASGSSPGQMRVSLASSGGTTSGAGSLALLEFEVIGSPGATTTLTIAGISLNDGAIPGETAGGLFSVNAVYELRGATRLWGSNQGIPGVQLSLQGDRLYAATADAAGAYTLTSIPAGAYTLTPAKSDGANGISAYDASLVLQHTVGGISLGGYAAKAADADRSGAITPMDAFYILQKAVDLIALPFPGAGVVWHFDPAARGYTNLASDQTGQDFTGVLQGDVSGNWSPADPTGRVRRTASPSAAIAIPELTVAPGSQITVPVTITPAGAVYGVDVTLRYSSTVVRPIQAAAGGLAAGWSVAANLATPGELRVALAGAASLAGPGELLLVNFEGIGALDSRTDLTLARGDLNEGGVPAVLVDGGLRIAYPQVFATIGLEGREVAPPAEAYGVPLRVQMFAGSATPAYSLTVQADGSGAFALPGIVPGAYTVRVKNSHTLANVASGIGIANGANSLSLCLLREGDADDNNQINIADFSILATSYGEIAGQAGFDPRADFNESRQVNIRDFSLLATNYGRHGDQSCP